MTCSSATQSAFLYFHFNNGNAKTPKRYLTRTLRIAWSLISLLLQFWTELCFPRKEHQNALFLQTAHLTLQGIQEPLIRQSIVLCDQYGQQPAVATNVFKQHITPCPLILAALTNSVIDPYPPTYFPLFPSAWSHKAESQTLLTCQCTVITISTFRMYVQTLLTHYVVKYLT